MEHREQRPADMREPRSEIDIEDAFELRYWARQFLVTEQELRNAVRLVGPKVAAVREALETGNVPEPQKGTKPGS